MKRNWKKILSLMLCLCAVCVLMTSCSSSGKDDKKFAQKYMHITEDEGWCWGLIRAGMSTGSQLFVMQMQDLLQLPGTCRMNTPGNPYGNWRWRMLPGAASDEVAAHLLAMNTKAKRG